MAQIVEKEPTVAVLLRQFQFADGSTFHMVVGTYDDPQAANADGEKYLARFSSSGEGGKKLLGSLGIAGVGHNVIVCKHRLGSGLVLAGPGAVLSPLNGRG